MRIFTLLLAFFLMLTVPALSQGTELVYDDEDPDKFVFLQSKIFGVRMTTPNGPARLLELRFYVQRGISQGGYIAYVYPWDEENGKPSETNVFEEVGFVLNNNPEWIGQDDVATADLEFDGDFVVGFQSADVNAQFGIEAGGNERSWRTDINGDSTWQERTDSTYLIRAVVEDVSTGLVEEISGSITQIFPNPVKGVLWVETSERARQITLTNSVGQHLLISQDIQAGKARLSLQTYPPGMYYLRISTEDEYIVRKVMVE